MGLNGGDVRQGPISITLSVAKTRSPVATPVKTSVPAQHIIQLKLIIVKE